MTDNILQYSKAIVAVVAPLVVALLIKLFNAVGVEFTPDVSNAVIVLLTAFFVWLIPNVSPRK